MIPPPDDKPAEPRSSVRMDARLDAMTRAKVGEFATRFHQSRAAVLCQIMAWGLSREHTEAVDQGASQGPVRHLHLYVSSDLQERVQKAATAVGVKIAPWLRQMVRHITLTDFPTSWQEATPRTRSHDSRMYIKRFMLRLDEPSHTKLEQLIKEFGTSKAEITRHLIAHAKPEDLPPSWHLKAAERRTSPTQQDHHR
jgi:hypothetical protein